jgi:DNA-directed RNA polymerase specialized sigma24 family protein
MLVGWCVRRTADPELAADLTAEVFATALVSAARYEPTHESAAGWLLGISRNVLGHSVRQGQVDARARERLGASSLTVEDEGLAVVLEIAAGQDGAAGHLLAELPVDERAAVSSGPQAGFPAALSVGDPVPCVSASPRSTTRRTGSC